MATTPKAILLSVRWTGQDGQPVECFLRKERGRFVWRFADGSPTVVEGCTLDDAQRAMMVLLLALSHGAPSVA